MQTKSTDYLLTIIQSVVLCGVTFVGITNSELWTPISFVMLVATVLGAIFIIKKKEAELNSRLWGISSKTLLISLVGYVVVGWIYYNSDPVGGLRSWVLVFQSLYALPFFFCGSYLFASLLLKLWK